jgi:type IV pilus assembly protein PilQ
MLSCHVATHRLLAFTLCALLLVSATMAHSGVPNDEETIRVFPLHNVPAQDLLRPLREFLEGRGTVAADERTNQIIVSGNPDALNSAAEIIAALDRPVRRVEVEATLIQAGSEFFERLGMAMEGGGIRNDGAVFDSGHAFVPLDNSAFFRAKLLLDQGNARSRELSSARVTVLESNQAELTVGTRIPFSVGRKGGRSLAYEDVLFVLNVIPRILSGGRIHLELRLAEDIPRRGALIERRSVDTTLIIEDGQVLLIGGQDAFRETSGSRGHSFGAELPFRGSLHGELETGSGRTRLIILVLCRIHSP